MKLLHKQLFYYHKAWCCGSKSVMMEVYMGARVQPEKASWSKGRLSWGLKSE